MAKFCFSLGMQMKRVEVIADDQDEIIEATTRMSKNYDFVVTSGGIGPTYSLSRTRKKPKLTIFQTRRHHLRFNSKSLQPRINPPRRNHEENATALKTAPLTTQLQLGRGLTCPQSEDANGRTTLGPQEERGRAGDIRQPGAVGADISGQWEYTYTAWCAEIVRSLADGDETAADAATE